jgi:uncharacterized membrane protein
MPEDEQYKELQRLIAALTERVYRLEQQAGGRGVPVEGAVTAPSGLVSVDASKSDFKSGSRDALESKIGGHWLNRVGIIAVLIGVAYFLKYVFDNEWVGPAGRVLIGLVSGLVVMLWSERVRRRGYAIFSYSLKAVGIGVLHLSLWASSQVYELVPNGLAFLAMTGVTAATVALALWQNAQVIAAFATMGAFITPVALSTGENNAVSLFTYIAILDVGALALFCYRPWIRVLVGSYVGTLLLYSAWHVRFYSIDQLRMVWVSVSVFFVVFVLAPFLAKSRRDSPALLILILVNAATYFLAVYDLFEHAGNNRMAAVAAVALASVYFFMAHQLAKWESSVTGQAHWTIGVALLIVAVPIGLDAHWITLGWFIEAGALVWVSRRKQGEFLKYLGATALALGVVRLVFIDKFDVTRLIFNERMMAFALAVAVLMLVARIVATAEKEDERQALPVLIVTINILALLALNQEIISAWRRQLDQSDPTAYGTLNIARDFAYSALWMTYGGGLMFLGFWQKSRFLRWQALILIAVTIGKVFLYDTSSLTRGYRILSLIALGVVLLATSFLYQRDWFKLEEH